MVKGSRAWWDKNLQKAHDALDVDPECPLLNRYARTVAQLYCAARTSFLADEDMQKILEIERKLEEQQQAVQRGQFDQGAARPVVRGSGCAAKPVH